MRAKTLVATFEIPRQGGAATNAYALFAKLQREGHDVRFLSVVEHAAAAYCAWTYGANYPNPDALADVYSCIVEGSLYHRQRQLADVVTRLAPDVILARGYVAASMLKAAAPSLPVVLSAAGSQQAEFSIQAGRARDALELTAVARGRPHLPWPAPGREKGTLYAVDSILPGSELSKTLYETFFGPDVTNKVHPQVIWSAEWVVEEVLLSGVPPKPFRERSTDVLFSATNWSRHEKNWPALTRLAKRLSGAKIKVIGEAPHAVEGAQLVGQVNDRDTMFGLLADAKVIAAPSLADMCPITLFQAAALDCNVVATKNCGNWMLCNEKLLVDPPSEERMADAIARGLEERLPDNLSWFLGQQSFARLLEVLDALGAR